MYHRPVMLTECLEGLQVKSTGTYVDATFGGGGHSMKILEQLTEGRLIVFDQDDDARKQAENIQSRSFTFCQANFRYLKQYLKLHGVAQVDGILADLGISSHQIDTPGRGFSTRFEGPLDMRMDTKAPVTAASLLNSSSEEQLHKILGMYGEVRNARTLASAMVRQRATAPYRTSQDLLAVLSPLAPRGKEFKYYAQVFQALRIEVNKELEALESFLLQCGEVIAPGGRLVIMSYHSLEDRMVKNYMNTGKVYGELEKDFYGNPLRPFRAINRKPIEASDEEVRENNRARSARLRIGEREPVRQ
ncbi:MAG: 16S rRNA (cytosine(1402)-N(4))-methyltransferase RsmH [Cyclobacteriaceae bacterium]|mgnify:CR=1 FL=1|jgi:16S rRNA (cytosine1402-N4)-methyltransferase|nr:16S rRNA (cytosine(1402)-N(4))-methyltransferase [Cytophagales bacterium]HNP78556.1 16S rRNA (cytosine(1402)-N(4))-methyltransferase RsmH [Cyclobacteriaceae bacterium]